MMVVFTDLGRMVSVFFLCFFLIGYVHGSALMYMISFFCLATIIAATIVARLGLRGVSCKRKLPGSTLFSGDPLDAQIVLTEKAGNWRYLEIFDQHVNLITGHTIHRRMTVMTENSKSSFASVAGARQPLVHQGRRRLAEMRDIMRFSHRGHYRLGPLVVNSYDPFGLVYAQRTFPEQEELIVYPHPLPVPELVLGGVGGRQANEVRSSGHAGETATFHSIRPYVHGDDLRRVHWKATAHTGKLAVKEFEFRSSGAVQIILDLQQGVHHGQNEYSTLEASVTIASSILNYVIDAGNRAGLLTTSSKVISLPSESGQRQLHRALEALALAKDDGATPLAQALASGEGTRTGRHTTVIITPTTDQAIIGSLLSLHGRSAQVLLVLIDPNSYFKAEKDAERAGQSLLSLVTKPINLKRGLQALTNPPRVPNADDHQRLLQAANAAGIDVFPVTATTPLHQALQGIRTRI